ncbi:MAG: phosphatidylglycerophosphatase A [Bacteroidetes bacterium]|nr:phosphatidylglycerophosphatase A [Bacteroidota bacterium]
MMGVQKAIAAAGGIGYIGKGAGSVAAAAYCILWTLTPLSTIPLLACLVLVLVTGLGVLSAHAVEKVWGHDSSRVVIDEVAGMMIALLFVPVQIKYTVTAFVLFRFFDIVKPLGVRKAEALPGGWGVMADDVLAGVYAQVLMRLIIALKLF